MLQIADGFAADHFVHRNYTTPFANAVAAADLGLQVELVGDGGRGSGDVMLASIQTGDVTVGLLFPELAKSRMGALRLAEYPGAASSPCALAERLWDLTAPGASVEAHDLAPLGLHRIFVIVMPDYQLLLTNEIHWIGLSSLRGRPVRTTTEAGDKLVRDLGGVPVRMSVKDMARGIADGRIEGALTTYETTRGRGLEHAFTGGTVGLDLGLVVQVYAMSETVWSKLSAAQRDGLTVIGRRVEDEGCRAVARDMDGATKAAISSGSITYKLGARDRAELRAVSRSLLQRIIDEDFGGLNPLGTTSKFGR